MTLDEYLTAHSETNDAFAERAGIGPVNVSRYRNGRRIPEPEAMAAIAKATDGAVTPNDFYGLAADDGAGERSS